MKVLVDSDLSEEFVNFRNGNIDLSVFQEWVEKKHDILAEQISAGMLLKLRRGDTQKVMASIAMLIPACTKCSQIYRVGPFMTRRDHARCASNVDMAVKNGDVSQIPKPNWAPRDNSQLGADAYFKCAHCGSVWTLVEPERQDNGTWERLA